MHPKIPARTVPNNTPNLAWLNIIASLPKERLAINKETVKPIPPNRLIPAKLLHVIPFTNDEMRHLMASHVNK